MEIFFDMSEVFLQSLLSAIILFILAKIMGFKQILQFTYFDYVVGITIGSIAASMAFEQDMPVYRPIISMCVYSLIALLISILSMKSIKLRRFLNGAPVVIMNKGEFINQNLKLVKLDINDFLSQARNAGYFDIQDIEAAIMEPNGMISFMPKSQFRPVCPRDLSLDPKKAFIKPVLIVDGQVMQENLKISGYDEQWINKQMQQLNIANINDVFLGTLDENHQLLIFLKQGRKNERSTLS